MNESGYSIHAEVLLPEECDQLLDSLEVHNRRRSAGSRNLFTVPVVRKIANDHRLISIAQEYLGGNALPYKAILFDKSEDCNWLVVWHQDRVLPLEEPILDPSFGPWTTKDGLRYAQAPAWALQQIVALRLHLDESTRDNGPLRVIPRSHALGLLEQSEVVRQARKVMPVTCAVPKGGVIAMRPLLIHSSQKSTTSARRRVIHIEYSTNLQLSETVRLALRK